jgi:glutamine amidotransferase
MFGYYGDVDLGKLMMKSLYESSQKDVFKENKAHQDGWGGVLINRESEEYIRYTTPLKKDNIQTFFHEKGGNYFGLFHARLSSPNEPKQGAFNSHPFIIRINGKEIAYIAHNGYVDKSKIAKNMGLYSNDFNNVSDTEIFSMYVEKLEGKFIDRIKKAIEFVNENNLSDFLNLVCLVVNREGNNFICYYSKFKDQSQKNIIYSRLIKYNNGSNKAVMSSTLGYYLGFLDEKGNILEKKAEWATEGNVIVL